MKKQAQVVKKLGKKIVITVVAIGFYKAYSWYNKPTYIKENNTKIEDLLTDNEILRMEKAIKKMGPKYHYIIEPNGVLKVRLNNKWYILAF